MVALVLVGLEVRAEEVTRIGFAREEVAFEKRDSDLWDGREGVEERAVEVETAAGEIRVEVGTAHKVGFAVGDVADVAVHSWNHAAHAGSRVADGRAPAVRHAVHEEYVADVGDAAAHTVLHEAHVNVRLAPVEIDAGTPVK